MACLSKYHRWHNQIIKRARKRALKEKPYDRHHVIPRSLGGTNVKKNIVHLTHREHFLIHWLLVKMHKGENKRKMWFAMSSMRMTSGLLSWQYVESRKASSHALMGNQHLKGHVHSAETRLKLGTNRGRKFSKLHRQRISLGLMGNKSYSGKTHSKETRQKIADWHTGRTLSKKTRAKIAKSRLGTKASDETRQKLRDVWALRKRTG